MHNHLPNHLQVFAQVINLSEQMRGRPKEREEEPGVEVGTLQRSSGSSLQEEGNLRWQHPGSRERQRNRPLHLRVRRLLEDIDYDIVKAEGERKAASMSKTQCTSFSFSLQLMFPLPGASAWRWGKWSPGAGDQQLFCWAAGRGATQHTDPFLLPRREWETAVSGALFVGLSLP